METSETRNYNCKDEELLAICRNALLCLKRDFADFKAFAPTFNGEYLSGFERKINAVNDLLAPKNETAELKVIAKRLAETMDSLIDPIARLKGYVVLLKDTIHLSTKDFGLAMLGRKISDRDAEGTLQSLLTVAGYLEQHRKQLSAAGFHCSFMEQFNNAVISITNDYEMQCNIIGKRKCIVQENLHVLNGLYAQLMDIINTGRLLYKNVNNTKFKGYSLSVLRRTSPEKLKTKELKTKGLKIKN
jgi:hypothetical protein